MTQTIKCYVIENDPVALLWMKKTLASFADVFVCGYATSKEEAIKGIKKEAPDLLLADIELDDGLSFEILEALPKSLEYGVIFITSYNQYALQALKLNAIDYITKPIDKTTLRETLDLFVANQEQKMRQLKNLLSYLDQKKEKKRIALPLEGYTELVDVDTIIYFKAEVNYCKVFIKDEKPILVSKPLKEFDNYFKENEAFFRIHQSYLINTSQISKIIKTKLPQVVMTNNDVLNVSRSNRNEFLEKILSL